MAIIIEGSTKCALCEKVLHPGEDITGLPAISNKNHDLYLYFDQGFHLSCFESWDRKEEILQVLEDEKEKFQNSDYYNEMALKYGKPNNNR